MHTTCPEFYMCRTSISSGKGYQVDCLARSGAPDNMRRGITVAPPGILFNLASAEPWP